MNDKFLIKLLVPSIEESYDIFIPINIKIGNAIELFNKAIYELSNGEYQPTNYRGLYNRDSGLKYPIDVLVRETTIRNGSAIILL